MKNGNRSVFVALTLLLSFASTTLPCFADSWGPWVLEPANYDPDCAGCVSSEFINIDHELVLQLVKTCPVPDPAHPDGTASGGHLELPAGTHFKLNELGWDITPDSHCGAGAPRFNVYDTQGHYWFYTCYWMSQYGTVVPQKNGMNRLTCNPANVPLDVSQSYANTPPFTNETQVSRIDLVMDETGTANLGRLTINGVPVHFDLTHRQGPRN